MRGAFLPDHFFGFALLGPVAENLDVADESIILENWCHFAGRPESRAILSQAPAFFAATPAEGPRIRHFFGELAARPVLGREQPVQRFAQHFLLGPQQEVCGPTCDAPPVSVLMTAVSRALLTI